EHPGPASRHRSRAECFPPRRYTQRYPGRFGPDRRWRPWQRQAGDCPWRPPWRTSRRWSQSSSLASRARLRNWHSPRRTCHWNSRSAPRSRSPCTPPRPLTHAPPLCLLCVVSAALENPFIFLSSNHPHAAADGSTCVALWLENDLDGAILLLLKDVIAVRCLIERQGMRGEGVDAQ